MKMEISQELLDDTIATLEFAQTRLEQEAAALLQVTVGHVLAEKRLEQARTVGQLLDFYLKA